MKKEQILRYIVCPLLIIAAWYGTASYTFNPKPDLNGDNIYYYTVASAMATGHGYSDLSKPGAPATSTFPPGYPVLMTPLRLITDSIVAQKWQNEVFVLLSLLLLYFALLRIGLSTALSFVSAFAGAFIPRLLHFSTMMMSESAFLLTAVLALYFLLRASEDEEHWYSELCHPWLWLAIAATVLNYHVRTQGLALIAALCFGLLIRRRWAALGVTAAGFVLGCLPWKLRNAALGMAGNRYIDSMMVANPWRPEEGTLTMSEFIGRFFETMRMLVFSAIPNTVLPFVRTNPDAPEYSLSLYLLGAVMIALMLLGCWQMGRIRWTVFGYVAANIVLISMFSTPSGSRYVTGILPILTMLELVGIWALFELIVRKASPTMAQSRAMNWLPLLMLPLLFTSKAGLKEEHEMSAQRYPLQYTQFFQMGKELKKNTPAGTVICSRKSQMLWMYADRPGIGYLYTQDDRELIRDLIDKQVDYVILDALGYSSTALYLYPAVANNPQYFPIVMQFDNTHQYLLRFLREKAAEELGVGK